MLNHLSSSQTNTFRPTPAHLVVGFFKDAERTASGVNFRSPGKSLIMTTFQRGVDFGFPAEKTIMHAFAPKVWGLGYEVCVNVNEQQVGVCLARKRSTVLKRAATVEKLMNRAKVGDFDIRAAKLGPVCPFESEELLRISAGMVLGMTFAHLNNGYRVIY